MKNIVNTEMAPSAIGPYSQGVNIGDFIFFSGQIPLDPKTGDMVENDIKVQTKQSLENVKALLNDQGLDFSNVVKTTVFLDNMDDFAAMNEVYSNYFVAPFPARSAVAVDKLPKDALVEVEVIAYKG
ncbi:MAG: RidA family protein [Beduini sp.]|uniref:RidA family protein n=1 Tax=Beduini sp. TaxID=1922300 RepID=UPI0039A2BB6F